MKGKKNVIRQRSRREASVKDVRSDYMEERGDERKQGVGDAGGEEKVSGVNDKTWTLIY